MPQGSDGVAGCCLWLSRDRQLRILLNHPNPLFSIRAHASLLRFALTIANGCSSRENLVGSGKDDLSDSLDRRVVFNVISC
jgi:hypothetical protein